MKNNKNNRKGYRYNGFTEWLNRRTEKQVVIAFVVIVLLYVWLAGSSIY